MGMSWGTGVTRRLAQWSAFAAFGVTLTFGQPAEAVRKKVAPKSATKTPAKPRPAAPSPTDREVERHVRQMGRLNRERVEAERGGDRKAITRVAKQVQLELKRHEVRRAALAKHAAKLASRPRKPAQ